MGEFERRPCKRDASCRWCDKRIEKGQEMVTGYTWRDRGISIHFCLPCAKKIGELAEDGDI